MFVRTPKSYSLKTQNMLEIDEFLNQGRYRITRPLGQNGAGEVYEAFDNTLETKVVLKENLVKLKKVMTLSQRQALKNTFANEAKVLTEIQHESFQRVLDYFSEIDRMYLVMETVDGKYLSEILETAGDSFSVSDAMNWTEQMFDALTYLHTQNPPLIYGNLKPQNIKLLRGGKIKILASGISETSQTKPDTFANQNFDTANLHYLPLEQIWKRLDPASQKVILNDYDEKSEKILKQPPDAQTDIYALGATVYYLLTGQLPIDALERSIDILDGKPDPLPSPHQINGDVPPEISEVLLKALEIRRENRFDSALIMRQVLRTAFVRIKEREAEQAKRREILSPEISYQQTNLIDEQEKLKAEAEKERQIELIQQQLREAEAQRLLAEQRAAEAEKRLLEKEKAVEVAPDSGENGSEPEEEIVNLNELESLSIPKFQEKTVPSALSAPAVPETFEFNIPQANPSVEYENLFSGVQKEKKSKRWMTAVALIVVAFSGVAFGVWFVIQSKSAESNQTAPSQTATTSLSDTTKPEPTVEPEPSPIAETVPEAFETPFSSSPDSIERPGKQPLSKNKSLPLPKTKKQTPSQIKTPPPAQKKAVTVDDLINDN